MTHAELRQVCESIASETRRHGIAPPVLVQAVLKHVPALLDELERVYQVMGLVKRLQFGNGLSVENRAGDYESDKPMWVVYRHGVAVDITDNGPVRYPTIQAALARAMELERGT